MTMARGSQLAHRKAPALPALAHRNHKNYRAFAHRKHPYERTWPEPPSFLLENMAAAASLCSCALMSWWYLPLRESSLAAAGWPERYACVASWKYLRGKRERGGVRHRTERGVTADRDTKESRDAKATEFLWQWNAIASEPDLACQTGGGPQRQTGMPRQQRFLGSKRDGVREKEYGPKANLPRMNLRAHNTYYEAVRVRLPSCEAPCSDAPRRRPSPPTHGSSDLHGPRKKI